MDEQQAMIQQRDEQEAAVQSDDVQSRSRADIERQVEAIWREVLGAPEGQPDATFFELGGQSISAVRMMARIEDELGVTVEVGDLFEDPTSVAFARAVAENATPADERGP